MKYCDTVSVLSGSSKESARAEKLWNCQCLKMILEGSSPACDWEVKTEMCVWQMCRQARPNRRNPKSSKSSLTFQNGESPPSSLPSWDSLLKILQKSASVNCTTGSTQFVSTQTLLLPSSILSANHELCPWSHQSFTGISRSLLLLNWKTKRK